MARRQRLESVGRPIPAYLQPPDIIPGGEEWLKDFWELSTDRQHTTYGTGPIPAASIARHCEGWEPQEAANFRVCIRAMDIQFLKLQAPGSENEAPESDNPARDAFRNKMR